jgi:tRNA(fMet)-specific endonuclease VapC
VTHYLLDTNILSDLVRNPQGPIAAAIARVGERHVCTSIVVAAELRFGAAKRGSERLRRQLDRILAAIQVLPFEAPADAAYAEVRARLEAGGEPIGGNDLLIAAHALTAGCVLVTDNVREFGRVAGLQVENWLR